MNAGASNKVSNGAVGGSQDSDSTLEYQFPKEFKKSIVESIDKRFAAIVLFSFLAHVSIVLYFSNRPLQQARPEVISKIQEQFVSLVLDKDLSEEVKLKEETAEGAVARDDEEASASKAAEKGKGGEDASEAKSAEERLADWRRRVSFRAKSREEISEEVSSKGLLGILASTSAIASGEEVADVLSMNSGGNGEDLDEVLRDLDALKKSGTPTGNGGARARKGRRATAGGNIDALVSTLAMAKATDLSRKAEIKIVKSTSPRAVRGKAAGRSSDAVLAVINSHMPAIQYCYQREWRRNPTLKGKIVIRFVIRPDGSVAQIEIVSSTLNSPRVERCILAKIRSWNFGPVDPTRGDAVFRQEYIFGY